MALRSSELGHQSITTSPATQTPEKTLRNALGLLTLMQREDIRSPPAPAAPAHAAGGDRRHVHGKTGMGTCLPTPLIKPDPAGAVS